MRSLRMIGAAAVLFALTTAESCAVDDARQEPAAASGVRKATVQVATGGDGMTTEQRNIRDRLMEDNKPGAIKHLYIISAYSGQVLLYSTVRGKVTSSGKRLTPTSVSAIAGQYNNQGDFVPVTINGERYRTAEVLQDDGSYGQSNEYIFWWDTKGVYHQHYVAGGQIVHVTSQPLRVPHIVLNLETEARRDSL